MALYNKYDEAELKKRLHNEVFRRKTVSFYRYINIFNPQKLRDELYLEWDKLGVLGRIYLAKEGVSSQMSVPENRWDEFLLGLNSRKIFENMSIRFAVDDNGKSFYKLKVKVRDRIVADGLKDDDFDMRNVGKYLTAEEFNAAMDEKDTIIVDIRNRYESEVGCFKGAICPDAYTFKQELPIVLDILRGKEDKKVLLYCTGGIRCEKSSAYLLRHGFRDVCQLHGGIISYAHQVKQKAMENKFTGKNFVFDDRLGERITEDIISECHQCGKSCDTHINCKNNTCHLLFIQCEECFKKYSGCCSHECVEMLNTD